eukprot:12895.XXX_77223_77492_1 [CDS] Oithona nana genome sequencing.
MLEHCSLVGYGGGHWIAESWVYDRQIRNVNDRAWQPDQSIPAPKNRYHETPRNRYHEHREIGSTRIAQHSKIKTVADLPMNQFQFARLG